MVIQAFIFFIFFFLINKICICLIVLQQDRLQFNFLLILFCTATCSTEDTSRLWNACALRVHKPHMWACNNTSLHSHMPCSSNSGLTTARYIGKLSLDLQIKHGPQRDNPTLLLEKARFMEKCIAKCNKTWHRRKCLDSPSFFLQKL